jgi:hypothetical protein
VKRPANVEQWFDAWGRSRGWYFKCAVCGSPGGNQGWQFRLTYPAVNRDGLAVCTDCRPERFYMCSRCGGVVPGDEMGFGGGGFGSPRYPWHKGCPVTAVVLQRDKAVTHNASIFGSTCRVCGRRHWGTWRICEQCGSAFRPERVEGRLVHRRPDALYCSNACRQKSYRQRKSVPA